MKLVQTFLIKKVHTFRENQLKKKFFLEFSLLKYLFFISFLLPSLVEEKKIITQHSHARYIIHKDLHQMLHRYSS